MKYNEIYSIFQLHCLHIFLFLRIGVEYFYLYKTTKAIKSLSKTRTTINHETRLIFHTLNAYDLYRYSLENDHVVLQVSQNLLVLNKVEGILHEQPYP